MTTVASRGTAVVTLPTPTQILITREFSAPPRLVYRAWTEPQLIRRWWSAKRGAVTVAEVDLRVGGAWRWVMDADGGYEVGFHGEYREIIPNERIVYTEEFEGMPGASTLNTLTLAARGGRTLMTILVECPSQEVRDAQIESGMEAGMQDAFDLLEEAILAA